MINKRRGNALTSEAVAILHQVNCQGVMGSGIARQVRIMYPAVYKAYREYCLENERCRKNMLGTAQSVEVAPNRYIINLFAQEYYGMDGACYTDYEALRKCLQKVNQKFKGQKVSIPYLMGCNRGGGNWNIVLPMIEEILADCDVTIYEL